MNLGDIIILILFFLSIAVALWYFFGNSPTLEEVILTFLLTIVFTLVVHVTKIGVRMEYIERDIKNSFNNIKNDIALINRKLKI